MELLKILTGCVVFLLLSKESLNQKIEINQSHIKQTTPDILKQNREARNCSPEKQNNNISRTLKPLNLRLNPISNPIPRKITAPVRPLHILLDKKSVNDSLPKDKVTPAVPTTNAKQKEQIKENDQNELEDHAPKPKIADEKESKQFLQKEEDDTETIAKEFFEDIDDSTGKKLELKQQEKDSIKSDQQTDVNNNTISYKGEIEDKLKRNNVNNFNTVEPTISAIEIIKNNTNDIKITSNSSKNVNETRNIGIESNDVTKAKRNASEEKNIPVQKETHVTTAETIYNNMGEVSMALNCTETNETRLASLVLNARLGQEDNSNYKMESKVQSKPAQHVKYDSNDSIVIRNNEYQEVLERSLEPSASYSLNDNIQPYELKSWSYIDDLTSPYQTNNIENYINKDYDETQYDSNSFDKQKDVYVTLDSNSNNYHYNPSTNAKDKVWRTWKNTEICIKTNNNDKSGNIERKKMNSLIKSNVVETPIFYAMIQPAIGCNGCYRNQITPAIYPYYFNPNHRYVY